MAGSQPEKQLKRRAKRSNFQLLATPDRNFEPASTGVNRARRVVNRQENVEPFRHPCQNSEPRCRSVALWQSLSRVRRTHHAFLEGGLESRPPFQLVSSDEFWSVVLTPFDQGGSESAPLQVPDRNFEPCVPRPEGFEISVGRGEQPNNLKNPYSVKTISKKADHVERNGKRNFRRRTLCPRIAILYVGALVNYKLWLLLEISS